MIVYPVIIEDINRPGVAVFTTLEAAEEYGQREGYYYPYERELWGQITVFIVEECEQYYGCQRLKVCSSEQKAKDWLMKHELVSEGDLLHSSRWHIWEVVVDEEDGE